MIKRLVKLSYSFYYMAQADACANKGIPQGLFYDMIDARNDQTAIPRLVNLDDQVSGYYTNQTLFNAFSSSITTLGNYKTNLLLQNSNTQSAAVTTLFSQYGY